MKIFLFIILSTFGFANIIYAQDNVIQITYKMIPNESFLEAMTKGKGEFREKLVKNLTTNFEELELILSFNKETSFYTIKELPLKNDGSSSNSFFAFAMKMAYTGDFSRKIGDKGSYFSPTENKDSDFVVYYPDLNWELKNETKIIAGHLCYKATGTREVVNANGKFFDLIEAWFSTNIPLPFGPLNYGGLPGEILEIDDGISKYVAIKTEPNRQIDQTIGFLEKDKIINIDEYNNLQRERMVNFRNTIENIKKNEK